jgi:hypothetical protein
MLRFLLPFVVATAGCATVAPYEREHLSDPTMQASMDPLLDRSIRKLHTAREAASGGDSRPAGGGCGCSN